MPSGTKADPRDGYIVPAPDCVLKNLETPFFYDVRSDGLYELDETALRFLASSPPVAEAMADEEARALVAYCLDEGLVRVAGARDAVELRPSPVPSLRYLLVHITDRCNLRCRHCFVVPSDRLVLPADRIYRLAEEFALLQGLRFIVSGGEPLLHPGFRELNERLPDLPFRSILLSNGTLIDRDMARRLRFHEVQVSIDGLEGSHDILRGEGSYRRAMAGLRHLAEAGIDLSVATMVHAANVDQFDELRRVLSEFPLRSWSVDVPCATGNLLQNPLAQAPAKEAAARLSFSLGAGHYGSSGAYACGAHLAAVMADGSICKCGHYAERPEGRIEEGLEAVWKRMRRYTLTGLDCRCSQLASCRGGCRYRAELFSCVSAPDPIQCMARGMPLGGDLQTAGRQRHPEMKGGDDS